ncbi:MAG TPA: hypothetical protein P5186_29265 [Candidatus Paceibacterota bacterium]|nr:hypothetical protein [Candidatus Paceibacterota bacterium]HSA01166.1 hypothetical protein [Candidatus Paceibacterota bacterium]
MSAKDISTSLTDQLSTILEDCRLIEPQLQAYLKVKADHLDRVSELSPDPRIPRVRPSFGLILAPAGSSSVRSMKLRSYE